MRYSGFCACALVQKDNEDTRGAKNKEVRKRVLMLTSTKVPPVFLLRQINTQVSSFAHIHSPCPSCPTPTCVRIVCELGKSTFSFWERGS